MTISYILIYCSRLNFIVNPEGSESILTFNVETLLV